MTRKEKVVDDAGWVVGSTTRSGGDSLGVEETRYSVAGRTTGTQKLETSRVDRVRK